MFIEKKRKGVPARLFSANGTADGIVTVANISDFFTKQIIQINATGLPSLNLEIKRFLTPTTFRVGPAGHIQAKQDLSAYTVALGANISAEEQNRPGITDKEILRAVYAEEPIVAIRTANVDANGDYYNSNNPVPVTVVSGGSGGSSNFTKILITRDIDKDITQAKFLLGSTEVRNYDLTYDIDKDLIEVDKTGS